MNVILNPTTFYKSDKQINQRKHASQRAYQRFGVYIDDFDLDAMCQAIYRNEYEVVWAEKRATIYWNTFEKFNEPVLTVFKSDTREVVTFLLNYCTVDIPLLEERLQEKVEQAEKDIVVGEFHRATKRFLKGRYTYPHTTSYGLECLIFSERMQDLLRTIVVDSKVVAIYHKENWYVE